jgi:hypothetical protein
MEVRSQGNHRMGSLGWVGGWISFAAIMMFILGSLHLTFGLVGLLNDAWAGWTNRNHALLSVSAWGWIQVALGVLVFIAAFGVVLGRSTGRIIGLVVASLSLVANFFMIPLNPWWALTILAIDVLMIWVLSVHWGDRGSDLTDSPG